MYPYGKSLYKPYIYVAIDGWTKSLFESLKNTSYPYHGAQPTRTLGRETTRPGPKRPGREQASRKHQSELVLEPTPVRPSKWVKIFPQVSGWTKTYSISLSCHHLDSSIRVGLWIFCWREVLPLCCCAVAPPQKKIVHFMEKNGSLFYHQEKKHILRPKKREHHLLNPLKF